MTWMHWTQYLYITLIGALLGALIFACWLAISRCWPTGETHERNC